ncbi:hypothetical protein GCK32_019431, partial [Trichostrongylus colubriformis]
RFVRCVISPYWNGISWCLSNALIILNACVALFVIVDYRMSLPVMLETAWCCAVEITPRSFGKCAQNVDYGWKTMM